MALLTLLYDSGGRVQELIDLSVADVTIGRCCVISVRGKGSKHRRVPIFGETEKVLESYTNAYRLKPNDALLTNRSGGRLTGAGISYMINKYKKLLQSEPGDGLALRLSPHLLRHSKATHLVNANVNIYHVRGFIGHTSTTTPQIYLTANPEVTRKAIEKASNKIVSNRDYYSPQDKEDLLTCLKTSV